jgi:hypothetical protein
VAVSKSELTFRTSETTSGKLGEGGGFRRRSALRLLFTRFFGQFVDSQVLIAVRDAQDQGSTVRFVGGIALVLVGTYLIAIHRKAGTYAIGAWNRTFPRLPVWSHVYTVGLLLGGIVATIFGLLMIFGVLDSGG